MFNFFKEKKEKKAREKHTYDLEIDNLAVPEIHTHKPETEKKESRKKSSHLSPMTRLLSRRFIFRKRNLKFILYADLYWHTFSYLLCQ